MHQIQGISLALICAADLDAAERHSADDLIQRQQGQSQDEISVATDWTLTLGARPDRCSDFGGATNPRFALVSDASIDLTAKLLYGSACRAPASVESYGAGCNHLACRAPHARTAGEVGTVIKAEDKNSHTFPHH